MSAYTNLAAKVFTDRYAKTSGWLRSSVPEDSMPANRPIEARIALILHPGGVVNQGGWFVDTNLGSWPTGIPRNVLESNGMYFRAPSAGWEQKVITKDQFTSPQAWFRRDWSIEDLEGAGLSPAYADLLRTARLIYYRMASNISWIPFNLASQWDQAISAGGMPWMLSISEMIQQYGQLPEFLNTTGRQEAWNALANQLSPIRARAISSDLEHIRNQAKRLEASVDFWNTVAAYSGVDIIYGKWEELKTSIRSFNKQKGIIEDNIRTMNALVAAAPAAFTPGQQAEAESIKAASNDLSRQANATLSGPFAKALLDEGMRIQGMGAVGPVVLISLGVTALVVTSATVAFITYLTKQAALTEASNRRVHEFAMIREKHDQATYEAEQAAVAGQEARLYDLLQSAQISPADYERQMSDLTKRLQTSGAALVKRREQTAQAIDLYNDNQKKASEGVAADFLSSAKWIAIAGAVGIFAIFAMPRIAGKK